MSRSNAPLPGRATPEGTATYAKEHPAADGHYRMIRGLTAPSLGFGSYLGDVGEVANRAYEEAALAALEGGLNLLDTAVNYRGQQSERDLGRALRRFGHREQVVVVTKGGFLAPDHADPRPPEAWVREELLEPGVVEPDEIVGGMHCMTPAYLRDQLDRSLGNLGLEAVDVYLVHNPETQLQRGVPRGEVDARLRRAFEELERQVEAGRVGSYGVATWDGLRVPADSRNHLNLARLLELASEAREEVAGDRAHSFGAVEVPVNLAMTEALTAPNQSWQGRDVPLLEAAAEAELMVLASASLFQGRLLGRLEPEVRGSLGAVDDLEAALQFARSAPGVTTALVGMGSPDHARGNATLARERAPVPEAVEALVGGR